MDHRRGTHQNITKRRDLCFGYMTGIYEQGWTYFSIAELEAMRLPSGMRIQRDIHFTEQPYEDVILTTNSPRMVALKNGQTKVQEEDYDLEW